MTDVTEGNGRAAVAALRRAASAFLFAALLVAGAARSAGAGSIGIQFDLSQSWISVLGGTIVVPPDGNLTADVLRVVVPGNTATDIQSGAATIKRLGIDLTIDKDILGQAHVTGTVDIAQNGSALGNLALSGSNGTVFLSVASLGLDLAIDPNLACTGGGCTLLGTFPITAPENPILTGALPIANIAQSGLASIDRTLSVTFGGFTAVVHLVGKEVKRTFVPEPSSASLLSLGLAVAALAGRGAVRVRLHRLERAVRRRG